MQKTISTIFLMMTLSHVIRSECLNKTALESIGFTDVLDAEADNNVDGAVCKKFTKVCVDPAKLKDNIKAILTNFKEGVKSSFGSSKGIVKKINNGLFKLKTKYEDEAKKAKVEEKLGEDKDFFLETIKSCTETECDVFGTSLDDPVTHKTCFNGMLKLIAKALCLIASSDGSTDSSLDSTGNLIGLAVLQAEADSVFDVCVNYIDKQCEVLESSKMFYKFAKNKAKISTGKAKKLEDACDKYTEIKACIATPDTCGDDTKKMFFEAFVYFGKDSAPGPEASQLEEAGTSAEEAENTTVTRLLEATSTCSFSVSSSATNLGDVESGIETDEFAGHYIWNIFISSVLIMIFK